MASATFSIASTASWTQGPIAVPRGQDPHIPGPAERLRGYGSTGVQSSWNPTFLYILCPLFAVLLVLCIVIGLLCYRKKLVKKRRIVSISGVHVVPSAPPAPFPSEVTDPPNYYDPFTIDRFNAIARRTSSCLDDGRSFGSAPASPVPYHRLPPPYSPTQEAPPPYAAAASGHDYSLTPVEDAPPPPYPGIAGPRSVVYLGEA